MDFVHLKKKKKKTRTNTQATNLPPQTSMLTISPIVNFMREKD